MPSIRKSSRTVSLSLIKNSIVLTDCPSSCCAYAQSMLLSGHMPQDVSWVERLSITDSICLTPLHRAVIGIEQVDIYQQLRLNSDCINKTDSMGRSPLHWAALRADIVAIEALLMHGASPNAMNKGQTRPLHLVCYVISLKLSKSTECARLLINAGADIEARDYWGRTALRTAAELNPSYVTLVQYLIDNGSDVNVKDNYHQTPLLKSINSSYRTTKTLLQHGATVEVRDVYGNTPISKAIHRNNHQALKLLLQYKAKTHHLLDSRQCRPICEGNVNILQYAAWYGGRKVMQALEDTKQHLCLSPRLIDDFDQNIDFRRAEGLKMVEEDRLAFLHLLSTIQYNQTSDLACYQSTNEDDEDDEDEEADEAEESFFDAKECIPDDC